MSKIDLTSYDIPPLLQLLAAANKDTDPASLLFFGPNGRQDAQFVVIVVKGEEPVKITAQALERLRLYTPGKPIAPGMETGGTEFPSSAEDATGVELIATERRRQVEQEDWTADHDDLHDGYELAIAGACYAMPPEMRASPPPGQSFSTFLRLYWPWDREWWKPTPENRIRELVKAGALIAAEIDRLKRAEQ